MAPFATKAQLYTVLNDRTAVDRQLDELRRSNAVRVMQASCGLGGGGLGWLAAVTSAVTELVAAEAGSECTSCRLLTVRLPWPTRLQLPAGKDEFAIMLTQDYVAALRRSKAAVLHPPPSSSSSRDEEPGGGSAAAAAAAALGQPTAAARQAAQVGNQCRCIFIWCWLLRFAAQPAAALTPS